MRAALHAAKVSLLCGALLAVGAPASATGQFVVGAASADITPPLAAPAAPNPADCDLTGTFDGPHLFSLEEPYKDLNGNGRYDANQEDGGPEPFLDCPTPTANGGTRAPDGRWDGIYLDGGSGHNRIPTAVLDPIWARTIVVGNGIHKISITVADQEGVFKEIWDLVRQKVRSDGGFGLDEMFMSSTHDESAPDTIGIGGPSDTVSGVDPFYVEFLIAETARSIEEAAGNARPATIRFGQIHPDDLIPCWSSYPFVADEMVGVMQARDRGGNVIATLVDYGIHAEELGFSNDDQDRLHLSSDWHHFARAALEQRYGGVAVGMAGPVGSVEMPKVFDVTRSFVPVGTHSEPGNGGCRTVYDTSGTFAPYGYLLSNQERGERIALWAERALDAGADSRASTIAFARQSLFVHIDNVLFAAAGTAGVFTYKKVYVNGVEQPQAPNGSETGEDAKTDIGWFTVGDGQFVTTPGELFPFTYAHSFQGPDDLPHPEFGGVHGWVMAAMNARWRFIEGLGEDMLGYIFPHSNAVGVPTTDNPSPDDTDRFGCGHSDDGEAANESAGDIFNDALLTMLPATVPASLQKIQLGRYVWSDGTLHRNPVGDGRLGCDSASSAFTPAPDGGAIGIWVLPPGVTEFRAGVGRIYRLRPSAFGPGRRNVRWMDLRGRAQGAAGDAPTMQTRGIMLGQRRRLWVDVFPETTGLTRLP
ncbi:MAG: hypothetical protein E6J68_05715 [Deltaproteobacteria bacterium]|nr:MAG: hypothetical protein E6J68_05715 [Deltaproteobacteria bacterium]